MYRPKEFYALSGVKRSTVRHYQREGLLSAASPPEGYASYTPRDLVDAAMVKNYRCMDFSIEEIRRLRSEGVDAQVAHMRAIGEGYRRQVEHLQKKLRAAQNALEILEQYQETGRILHDPVGRELWCFSVEEALRAHGPAAKEEIERCVNAFPFVHAAGEGVLADFLAERRLDFRFGYLFNPSAGLYEPAHPQVYRTLSAQPCCLVRIKTADPLSIPFDEVRLLASYCAAHGLTPCDGPYSCISGVERAGSELRYCVSVRILVSP